MWVLLSIFESYTSGRQHDQEGHFSTLHYNLYNKRGGVRSGHQPARVNGLPRSHYPAGWRSEIWSVPDKLSLTFIWRPFSDQLSFIFYTSGKIATVMSVVPTIGDSKFLTSQTHSLSCFRVNV